MIEASFAEQPGDERDPAQLEAVLRESRNANTPWMHWLLGHDPTVPLRAMRCDVLALFGSKDLQVDPEQNRAPLAAALEESACDEVRIITLDGLNHLFQNADTGSPSEYASIEETFAPEALDRISGWIRHVTGLGD
ncbi:MAG: hypothetical protein IPM29_31725 [Planctomycetes bacterium]|nr:hypothetical protein [Planctomycetota bacterium]